jgi:hypothetical protein
MDRAQSCPRGAYTLVETVIAAAIFSLVLIAVLGCHIGGLKMNENVRPKVENSRYARETLAPLIEEVRSASSIQVGTGNAIVTNFSPAAASQPQTGNALKIFPTTNSTPYIYYFRDTNTGQVFKIPLSSSNSVKIATAVTNKTIFSMEDFKGTVLTNSQNNAVLSVLLQMQRNVVATGVSDTWQVRTKITRRAIL